MKGELLEWPLIICGTVLVVVLFGPDFIDSIYLLISFWGDI